MALFRIDILRDPWSIWWIIRSIRYQVEPPRPGVQEEVYFAVSRLGVCDSGRRNGPSLLSEHVFENQHDGNDGDSVPGM